MSFIDAHRETPLDSADIEYTLFMARTDTSRESTILAAWPCASIDKATNDVTNIWRSMRNPLVADNEFRQRGLLRSLRWLIFRADSLVDAVVDASITASTSTVQTMLEEYMCSQEMP